MSRHQQTRGFKSNPEDDAFLKALKDQMPPDMPAQRILAITAQFVGQLIALQDAEKITPEMAIRIVQENIEIGNQAALLTLMPTAGSS